MIALNSPFTRLCFVRYPGTEPYYFVEGPEMQQRVIDQRRAGLIVEYVHKHQLLEGTISRPYRQIMTFTRPITDADLIAMTSSAAQPDELYQRDYPQDARRAGVDLILA